MFHFLPFGRRVFFLLLGQGARFIFFAVFGRRVLFLAVWPGACFFFFGGGVFFSCCWGGEREFTHLPACLLVLRD